jgi:CO/xanthine dehydrogenase Mo-binding subunit
LREVHVTNHALIEAWRRASAKRRTSSPLAPFGQKETGEAGYLGAPAGAANAVNDALAPLGVAVNTLPLSHLAI